MMHIQIKAIRSKEPLPKADDPRVVELARSIDEIGQLQPIVVRSGGDSQWELVCGRHRVAAQKLRKESIIEATELDVDDLGAELATIDENLCRGVPTALEKARQLKRRKEIYELLHPTAKQGGAPGKKGGGKSKTATVAGFAKDTAGKTGESERSVHEYVRVAEKIAPDVQAAIAETPAAQSITELTKLARLGPDKQREVAAKVKDGKTVKAAAREVLRAAEVAKVRAHTPPIGEYPVIVIDPPWSYEDQLDGSDAARGGTPYSTMTIDQICELKLPLAKDAAVFLWVTNSHLVDPLAYAQVARSWQALYGLVPKQIRTWIKPRMGLGRVWRNDTEHLVLFVRGRPVFAPVTQTTSLMAPLGAHSEKPQQAFDDIWELCPAEPKLEMFARGDRKGWVTNGAEAPKASARAGLRELAIHRDMANEEPVEGRDFVEMPGGSELKEQEPAVIAWKPKKHPTIVAVGEAKERRWRIERQKSTNYRFEFFWRCEHDSSKLFDTEDKAKTDAAQQELLWQSEELRAAEAQSRPAPPPIDDGTLCGIRPSKNGDGCIHKQGHEGVHSNGKTTWRDPKNRKLKIRYEDEASA